MKNKITLLSVAIAAVCILSSCSALQYSRPDDLKSNGLYGTMAQESESETLANLSWKEIYTDPCLQALITEALAKNIDYRTQEWVVKQAETGKTTGQLAFLPSIGVSPQGAYSPNTGWSYQIPGTLTWELDILRKSRSLQMANAKLSSQQDMLQAVQSRLVANVASMYYQLLALDKMLEVAQSGEEVLGEMVYALESMMEAGIGDAVAVAQFKSNAREYEVKKYTLEANIRQVEIELCRVLGREPEEISRTVLGEYPVPENLSVGLSTELLDNRPDVRAAERKLEYYFHNIGYARSNFYPKITLSAEAMFNGTFVSQFIGGLVQPIFNQYKTIAALKKAKSDYEIAKLSYQQSLINAGSEVVLALDKCNGAKKKRQARELQIEECKKAVEFSRTQMFNGESTYLDVLTAQNTYFEKQQGLIQEMQDELLGAVELYLALGGGSR